MEELVTGSVTEMTMVVAHEARLASRVRPFGGASMAVRKKKAASKGMGLQFIVSDEKQPKVTLAKGMRLEVVEVSFVDPYFDRCAWAKHGCAGETSTWRAPRHRCAPLAEPVPAAGNSPLRRDEAGRRARAQSA